MLKKISLSFVFALFVNFNYSQNPLGKAPNKPDEKGMSVNDYTLHIGVSGKPILVVLEADWCVLCKKLKPLLDEIAIERKDKVELLHINTVDNPMINDYFEVDGLPIMLLYKTGKMVFTHQGLMSKTELLANIDACLR